MRRAISRAANLLVMRGLPRWWAARENFFCPPVPRLESGVSVKSLALLTKSAPAPVESRLIAPVLANGRGVLALQGEGVCGEN